MVDIVNLTDTFAKVDEVAYCCEYIVKSDVLGDKILNSVRKLFGKRFNIISALIEYFTQYLEANLLVDTESLSVDRFGDISCDIYHTVAENLCNLLFREDNAFHNACLLDHLCLFSIDEFVFVNKDLTCCRIYNRLSRLMSRNS